MSSSQRPLLVLQPSVNTTTVVTTTTTTTTYAPIHLPSLPPPSSPKDPKSYPLLHATLPQSLRNFPLVFPGGQRANFHDGEAAGTEMQEEQEVVGGSGWRMLKREETTDSTSVVGLADAVERFGKKRSLADDNMMEGVESTSSPSSAAPPRKKARNTPLPQLSTAAMNAAAPPSPLPSPHGSPPPEAIWPSAPPSGTASPPPHQAPLQPDLSLTTLLTLPSLLNHFSTLPPQLQSHFLLTLLRHSPLPVLRTLHSVLTPTLARDFLTLLPRELASHVLSYLPFPTLARASRVSKAWRTIIDSDIVLWRDLLKNTKIWFGGNSETAFANSIYARRRQLQHTTTNINTHTNIPKSLPLPHPYKMLFKSRHLTRSRWVENDNPKHISFQAHGSSVVTCLLFSHGRIISASDDHSICIYSPVTGELIRSLEGHEGGVWALAASKDTLVSGSTDRTVRIWDMSTGKCTHVFGGHTSTVRCLAIVKPEVVEVVKEGGEVVEETWPKRPLIVTGSRDHSLRVWKLPKPGEQEYKCLGTEEGDPDPEDNPYHCLHLPGHDHAVRALAARGRTLVSGSYDCSVRIWDIITGEQKWMLVGHTQKVYSVVLDVNRKQACSGSMDGTVRVWNLVNGQCQHTLTGHTSLVGLLGLSPSYLVSAAADSTLRIWDPESGELRHTLAAHTGAITCFQHDEFKVLSGSDGNLKMWNIRDGTVVRDLLTGITGVWQVVFEGRWCVAASNRNDMTVLDVWDFGTEVDDEWIGEPPNGVYDDETFENEEFEEEDEDMKREEDGEEEEREEEGEDVNLDVVREKRSMLYEKRVGKKKRVVDIVSLNEGRGDDDDIGISENGGADDDDDDDDDDDEQEQADVDAMDQDLVPSDSEYSELEVVGRITADTDGHAGPSTHERRVVGGHKRSRRTVVAKQHQHVLDSDDDYILEAARIEAQGSRAGSAATTGSRFLGDAMAGSEHPITAVRDGGSSNGNNNGRHSRSTSSRQGLTTAMTSTTMTGGTHRRKEHRERDRGGDREREKSNEPLGSHSLFTQQPSASSSSRSLPIVPSYQDTPTRPRIRHGGGGGGLPPLSKRRL